MNSKVFEDLAVVVEGNLKESFENASGEFRDTAKKMLVDFGHVLLRVIKPEKFEMTQEQAFDNLTQEMMSICDGQGKQSLFSAVFHLGVIHALKVLQSINER